MKITIIGLFTVYINLVQADKVVMTSSGPVQGVTVESDGILVETYLGVPYAEPPVGRLRFSKPIRKTHWEGVYDASRLPPPCIQNVTRSTHFTPDISNMSEDCLYLNIWVPHSQVDTRLKTVLFFIHGGAFVLGSTNMKLYDGAKLAARGDIVVVTINYRLGALGFLLTSIDDAGGNMGLRDQILALQWIRSNAVSFHGDPDNIVAMGQSAGAMSVSCLIMSPVSKHMIKRAIVLCGTPMTPVILDENDKLHKVSQKFASLVGCADKKVTLSKYPRKIVKCLKSVPPTEISRAEGILTAANAITFYPRMEDDILPLNTVEMIRNGELKHAEMLIGIVKNEGALFLTAAAPEYFGMYDSDTVTLNKHMTSQIIRMSQKMLGVEGSKKVADFYVGSVENGTSEKYLAAISEFVGDLMITCTSIFQAEFHSIRNPVYFYKLTHRSEFSPLAEWMSVAHFDDLQYIFGNPMFGNFSDEDHILSNRIMDRWISFAKTGNPNIQGEVEWPLFTYKNPQYLEINMKERVLSRPDDYRCEFWRQIFQAEMDDNLIQRLRSSAAILTSKSVYLVIPMFLLVRHKL